MQRMSQQVTVIKARVASWLTKYSTLIAVIVVASFLVLFRLGTHALIDNDEATYARVLRESLTRGEHLSLWLAGQPWFEKPPLFFWMMGAASKTLGGMSEFSMRLPSALSYVACVALTWLITLHRTRERMTATLAGVILMTTGFFLYAGRQVRMDIPVTAAILLGLWCMMQGLKKEKWLLGVGISAGIGVLFKSAIGLLVYPIIIIYALFARRKDWLANRWFWLGNMFGLVIAMPWHLYMSMRFGQSFWDQYLGYHVIQRTLEQVTVGDQVGLFRYMIVHMFSNSTPWLYLAVILTLYIVINRRLSISRTRKSVPFFAIGFFTLGLFLIPKTKLPYYFLPAFPFISIAVAMEIRLLLRKFPQFTMILLGILLIISSVFTGFKVFSLSTYNAMLEKTNIVSESALANIERTAGQIWKKEDSPLAVYVWDQFEFNTIRYYSHHKLNPIFLIQGEIIDNFEDIKMDDYDHFLLLVPSSLRPIDPYETPNFIKKLKVETVHFDRMITIYRVSK